MIKAVPTNIITGFLGVGKTSTLLHLLKQKPRSERWALLINEFGEVGVDGAIVSGSVNLPSAPNTKDVFIKEVPGGCMCCTAGLPMQVALNQLLALSKPHRLLIEPTGLGHPKEVLQTLSAPHYRDVLEIHNTLTLVDARKLTDNRYTTHPTFNQQIDIADVIVGNKHDLYTEKDKVSLSTYISVRGKEQTPITYASHGAIDISLLKGQSKVVDLINAPKAEHLHHHEHTQAEPQIPQAGFLKIENEGEGFHAVGWRYAPDIVFNRQTLLNWIAQLNVERLKAVVITNDGIFSLNLAEGMLSERELNECLETRIEIIAAETNSEWDAQLAQCKL